MSTAAPLSDPICIHNVPLPTPEQLPNDLDTLKRMIVELMTTLRQERRDKHQLQHRLDLLLQRLYGPRTERINPDQLLLFVEWAATPDDAAATVGGAAANSAASEAKSRSRQPKTPHGRGKLPENLPRRPVHHQLSEAERMCRCGRVRIEIGTDVNELVEWQPASVFVWQHFVHKYLCPHCCQRSAEAAMTPPGYTPEEKTTGVAPATVVEQSSTEPRPIGPAVIAAPTEMSRTKEASS